MGRERETVRWGGKGLVGVGVESGRREGSVGRREGG